MSTMNLSRYIGQSGHWLSGCLSIAVTITDVKVSYGRQRYKIRPIAGEGEMWVESGLTIDSMPEAEL